MDLKVREANFKDLHKISELFDLYRQFYGQKSDRDAAFHFLKDRMEHRQSILLLATDLGQDVALGFIQLYPVFSSISMERSFLLNDLYVLLEYRKKGIAKLLINEAKKYTEVFQGKGLELSTSKHNLTARRLYEREGFEEEKEFLTYFWKRV